MDPLTQGLVGAAATQVTQIKLNKKAFATAALLGALGGMAPDLDILIRSQSDPLLALEYHRHFTHSLFFIPFGGLLCAVFACLVMSWKLQFSFKQAWLWSTVGYATHALLDVCTSYGTQVLWPFSNFRLSIDIISVIDPLFTLPLLLAVMFTIWLRKHRIIYAGILWCACYLSLGAVQHARAINEGERIATERGHVIERLHAKPSFANILVWKTIYESSGHFYVDAVRLGIFNTHIWQGQSQAKLNLNRDLPWLDHQSQQAKDIERFRWFSDGFIAIDKQDSNLIVDMRYSLVPNEINALWGIRISPTAAFDEHVEYETMREDSRSAGQKLWAMVKGP